jgi:hypothetical protein
MSVLKTLLLSVLASVCVGAPALAQTSETSSSEGDKKHAADVDRRGDQGMGFSHRLTGHHFLLFANGGAIEVEADRPNDDASKAAIRRHMEMIAGMFGQGDFSLPMFIHDTVPPGVEVMKRLKAQISYAAENTAQGAQVRITTSNPEALAAVHEFLRFQIKDHRTGDQMTIRTGQ